MHPPRCCSSSSKHLSNHIYQLYHHQPFLAACTLHLSHAHTFLPNSQVSSSSLTLPSPPEAPPAFSNHIACQARSFDLSLSPPTHHHFFLVHVSLCCFSACWCFLFLYLDTSSSPPCRLASFFRSFFLFTCLFLAHTPHFLFGPPPLSSVDLTRPPLIPWPPTHLPMLISPPLPPSSTPAHWRTKTRAPSLVPCESSSPSSSSLPLGNLTHVQTAEPISSLHLSL